MRKLLKLRKRNLRQQRLRKRDLRQQRLCKRWLRKRRLRAGRGRGTEPSGG
jgi:hypothetical protein